jgi:hypothetical protein
MARADWTGFLRNLPEGWVASRTSGGHVRLMHPDAPHPVFAPSTPSDWRCCHQTRAQMRRALRSGGMA